LRLLSPVWLVSISATVFLFCLTPFRFVSYATNPILNKSAFILGNVVSAISLALTPLLAGTLSVGEERTVGTQAWNLILPMSIRRQWLLKLVTGILTCVLCQALVLNAASMVGGTTFRKDFAVSAPSGVVFGGLITLSMLVFTSAFWSAC